MHTKSINISVGLPPKLPMYIAAWGPWSWFMAIPDEWLTTTIEIVAGTYNSSEHVMLYCIEELQDF